jgi:hypothetical protein
MRTYRSLHQWVDPQFGKLAPDPLVQLAGIEELGGDGLVEVDVDVEAAAGAVCYGVGEGGVGGGFLLVQGWGVEEGFGVGAGGFLGAGEGRFSFWRGWFLLWEDVGSYVDRGGRFS